VIPRSNQIIEFDKESDDEDDDDDAWIGGEELL